MLLKVFLDEKNITPEDILRLTLFSISDDFEDKQLKETFKLFRRYRHAFAGAGYYDMDESNPLYVSFDLNPLEFECFLGDIQHLNHSKGSTC